jgi:hypothetical protein
VFPLTRCPVARRANSQVTHSGVNEESESPFGVSAVGGEKRQTYPAALPELVLMSDGEHVVA